MHKDQRQATHQQAELITESIPRHTRFEQEPAEDSPIALELSGALCGQWSRHRKRIKICRKNATESSIHELRTSTRRLLSILDLCQLILPLPILSGLRKQLKAQLDQLDYLRDIQVMIEDSSALLPVLPELEDFHHHIQKQERDLLLKAREFTKTIFAGKLGRKIKKASCLLKKQLQQSELESSVISAINHIHTQIIARYHALDGNKPETLHALRIKLKKFRYILESLPFHITNVEEERYRLIQSYLAELGDIQNIFVLNHNLAMFYSGQVPIALASYFQQRQKIMIKHFLNHSADALDFWQT